MITVKEMRDNADACHNLIWGDEFPSMINKLCAVIWYATAEICERLDEQKEKATEDPK